MSIQVHRHFKRIAHVWTEVVVYQIKRASVDLVLKGVDANVSKYAAQPTVPNRWCASEGLVFAQKIWIVIYLVTRLRVKTMVPAVTKVTIMSVYAQKAGLEPTVNRILMNVQVFQLVGMEFVLTTKAHSDVIANLATLV